jgi:hypothetical protein
MDTSKVPVHRRPDWETKLKEIVQAELPVESMEKWVRDSAGIDLEGQTAEADH